MNKEEAIKVLDGVIPSPDNKMVDAAHLNIALAWQTLKPELEKRSDGPNPTNYDVIQKLSAPKFAALITSFDCTPRRILQYLRLRRKLQIKRKVHQRRN